MTERTAERRRKTLSEYLRKGAETAQRDGTAIGAYYDTDEKVDNVPVRGGLEYDAREVSHEAGPLWHIDPIMMIFVGKFGPDVLASIGREHRRSFDHGWEGGRVWDVEHVSERLTKAINGGLSSLHQRLHELPRLEVALRKLGYRGEARFTSVFRAITYMSDVRHMEPLEIAAVLEEGRV